MPGALHALESLGGALEDHLQLLLPALVRLICSGKRLIIDASWNICMIYFLAHLVLRNQVISSLALYVVVSFATAIPSWQPCTADPHAAQRNSNESANQRYDQSGYFEMPKSVHHAMRVTFYQLQLSHIIVAF